MIHEENFVSLWEIAKNTKSVFTSLPKTRKRFVMENDKPVWVVMSIDEYNMSQIPVVEPDEWEIDAIAEFEKNKLSWNIEEWVDAFEFLEKLQNGGV